MMAEKREWDNVPFKTWEYQEQTKLKHQILRYYFPQWLRILGSWHRNLNYIDGFGGLGAYHTKEDVRAGEYVSKSYGSPILAISAIDDLMENKKINRANALIIDAEQENITNIQKILKYAGISGSIHTEYICGNFDNAINNFMGRVGKLAPTLFLIDPFGFTIELATLQRIMSYPRSEILLNFMYNAIQRWVSVPNLEERFNRLFGCTNWKEYADGETYDKERQLVELFRRNCKTFAKFVYPFRLCFPKKNRSYYYLFHLCHHRKGCILIKDSFAKFNLGKLEYRGRRQNQLELGLFAAEDEQNWEGCLFKKFSGVPISYGELLDNVIDLIPYTEREFKKLLQKLEKEGKIEISAEARRRRAGIEWLDVIEF